jgi:hypothetical protein
MIEVLHRRLMLRVVVGTAIMLPIGIVVVIGLVLLMMVKMLLLLVVHVQPAHVELRWNETGSVFVLDLLRCRYPDGHRRLMLGKGTSEPAGRMHA